MKYLRTEDEIGIIVEEGEKYFIYHTTIDVEIGYNTFYSKNERHHYKTADTIKELCDEFVYVDKDIHYFLVSDDLDLEKAKQYETFGAIWTDNGLIYVAKMNDKGELELL